MSLKFRVSLDFQLECLKEYRRIYKRIDLFLDIVTHKKPVVILYDTIPEIGQTYLKNKDITDYKVWKAFYDKYLNEIFESSSLRRFSI